MRLIAALLGGILLSLSVCAEPIPVRSDVLPTDLRVAGSDQAPATVYLFSSFSCPHCSAYHANVLPALYKAVIEPGMAKLVFVDMPYDSRSMMGTLLSRCVPVEQYDAFTSVVFQNQSMWQNSSAPRPVLTGYAKLVGMTDEQINRCLSDKELQKALVKQRDNLANLYGVRGMPTTVVVKNGKHKSFVGTDTDVLIENIKKELQ